MSGPYRATIIAALFTCVMGTMYLIAFHIEGQADDIFRQAFIAGVTITTGSIAVERMTHGDGKPKDKE